MAPQWWSRPASGSRGRCSVEGGATGTSGRRRLILPSAAPTLCHDLLTGGQDMSSASPEPPR
eukprot:150048-Pyramimonas_sp.AAC.1